MSTARFDTIVPSAGGTGRNAPRGIAAAWANLSGFSTISLRNSGNVSSVTDNGTGNYTFNLTNSMTGHYSGQVSASATADASTDNVTMGLVNRSSSSFTADIENGSGAQSDAQQLDALIHGDLA